MTEISSVLRPWREVVQPHEDVIQRNFDPAEFAADLYSVSQGRGPAEYVQPVDFFERTFLTSGLTRLLSDALKRVTGQGGHSVIDLQTTFGGGKTHSMIALYHLFSGLPIAKLPSEVVSLVSSETSEVPQVRRAVIVGTELRAGEPYVKDDGTEVGTMWGEIAWQLGGADAAAAFAIVAEADRSRTNPADRLRELMEMCAPCVILIDEWVAYARQLFTDDGLRGGTFDTHFTFAQSLMQAVKATKGAFLAVSVPSSDASGEPQPGSEHEVGGAGGREALRRIRSALGRLESSWRSATPEESFEIVRRRLFQPIPSDRIADRDAVVDAFRRFYSTNSAELPSECSNPGYADEMQRAYPIHPELFARLYGDWATLERFQRTRGVLRFIAQMVKEQWVSGSRAPLILPGDLPLDSADVVNEVARSLDEETAWRTVISTEVDGEGSLPDAIDNQFANLGAHRAAHRVARTVFIGTAPRVDSPNRGVDISRIRLGCALPGEQLAVYGDALGRLTERGTYFYAGTGRYWFGLEPGVTRLARQKADELLADRHEIDDEIVRRLRRFTERGRAGGFAGVHLVTRDEVGINDEATCRLVIIGHDRPHVLRSEQSAARQVAGEVLEMSGRQPRTYKNMLVFLVADQRRVDDLVRTVADHLAWKFVSGGHHNLREQQQEQSETRATETDDAVETLLSETYQWLLVPDQRGDPTGPIRWEEVRADGEGSLTSRAFAKLVSAGHLYSAYAPALLRYQLDNDLAALWDRGFVPVQFLWDAYARYPYLHRLRDIDVLRSAIVAAAGSRDVARENVAVASFFDTATGRYVDLERVRTSVVDSDLVVKPEVAADQRAKEEGEAIDRLVSTGSSAMPTAVATGSVNAQGTLALPPEPAKLTRFDGRVRIDPVRMGIDAPRIASEVVSHLAGLDGTNVSVEIYIDAERKEGFPDDVVKIIKENTDALKFGESTFGS